MSSDGTMGTGKATGMATGKMEITLNGKVYRGSYVTARGGSVGFGTTGAASFTTTATDASTAGNAMLRGDDGGAIQCRFIYSDWSRSGTGQCRDNDGKVYELQIT